MSIFTKPLSARHGARTARARQEEEAMNVAIKYWMAECYAECDDPQCPYIHRSNWEVNGKHFLSEVEAEAYVSQLKRTGSAEP